GISGSPNIGDGGKGRVKNHPADLSLGGHRNGDSRAERLAPEHDAFGRIARGRELVGRHAVVDQTGLAWLAGRAPIAAISECDEAGTICGQPLKPTYA